MVGRGHPWNGRFGTKYGPKYGPESGTRQTGHRHLQAECKGFSNYFHMDVGSLFSVMRQHHELAAMSYIDLSRFLQYGLTFKRLRQLGDFIVLLSHAFRS